MAVSGDDAGRDRHLPGSTFDDEIFESECLVEVRRRLGTSQDGAHPRHQFTRGERLGDVVVGSQFEAEHSIGFLDACGQHDDWNPGRSHAAQHIEPGDAGEHDVEHDEIGLKRGDRVLDQVTTIELVDDVAIPLQVVDDNFADSRFVVDDQDPCCLVVHAAHHTDASVSGE